MSRPFALVAPARDEYLGILNGIFDILLQRSPGLVESMSRQNEDGSDSGKQAREAFYNFLLVPTVQHHPAGRRIKVQPDNIGGLARELRGRSKYTSGVVAPTQSMLAQECTHLIVFGGARSVI
jgi:hypothetical protein